MLACLLRPGNAGSEHRRRPQARDRGQALVQAGMGSRPGKKVLIRIDGAGSTKKTLEEEIWSDAGCPTRWDTRSRPTPRRTYRVIPEHVWEPLTTPTAPRARERTSPVRPVCWISRSGRRDAESSSAADVPTQGLLRFQDVDGYPLTAFATNTTRGQELADLEVRHRRRARCEDRIRLAKDMGLQNLPLKTFAQNRIWCQIIALASGRSPPGWDCWPTLIPACEEVGTQTPAQPPVHTPRRPSPAARARIVHLSDALSPGPRS